jgi:hypothetical protein
MKEPYEAPQIVDEQSTEAQAMACNKVPGLGDPNFCGQVWVGQHGNQTGCSFNPDARSS